MKTSIYIEDGTVQLVITPESEFEKKAIDLLVPDHPSDADRITIQTEIFRGAFYDCRGGWVRQSTFFPHATFEPWQTGEKSLILRTPTDKERIDL